MRKPAHALCTFAMPRALAVRLLLCGMLAGWGCGKPAAQTSRLTPVANASNIRTTALNNDAPPAASQAALAHVHGLPLYRQAEHACPPKQYSHAADLLHQLTQDKTLTAEEAAFVQQQRTVCLRDAGGRRQGSGSKPSAAVSSPTPSTGRPLVDKHLNTDYRIPTSADCGPRALLLACERLGVKTTLPELRAKAGTTAAGTSLAGLEAAAKAVGLQAEGVQVSREALPEIATPALAYVNGNHFVTVLTMQGKGGEGTAVIHDPNSRGEETISQERLLRLCSGYLLLLRK